MNMLKRLASLILAFLIGIMPLALDQAQANGLRRPRALPLSLRIAAGAGGAIAKKQIHRAIVRKSTDLFIKRLTTSRVSLNPRNAEVVTRRGLRFAEDTAAPQGHRLSHVMDHFVANAAKPTHSVFRVAQKDFIKLADTAWANRGTPVVQGLGGKMRDVYTIDTGRKIGTLGERFMVIVTEHGTSNVVTMFPKL